MTGGVLVHFVQSDGTIVDGEGTPGISLMRLAQQLNVRGIIAECGGAAACSTCHCYVAREWLDRLDPMQRAERGMLRLAIDVDERSRLACQIPLQAELNGLVVDVPRAQA